MKKDENQKINQLRASLKNDQDFRSRSHSPKAYLGCDTCKSKNNELKKVKSISKFSESGTVMDKNKVKKPFLERDKEVKKPRVKLTDLCDEDKKRIVELIEELSKFADKNQKLKESLDRMQKIRQEQQDYIMKQANLHLEEKNFYVNEINEYKNKIEIAENEMKNRISQWESRERLMDAQITCLGKALQKLYREKNELNEQSNHLKICLRQSMESFQRLRSEVSEVLRQDQFIKKFRSISCQTEVKTESPKEKYKASDDDTDEEEFLSTSNQDNVNAKSSLDVINDKLEHVYQFLKRKSESIAKRGPRKFDIDLSILLKNQKFARENTKEIEIPLDYPGTSIKESSRDEATENGYKFLKPFDQCSKTSMQAERILKKMERPLNLVLNDCSPQLDNKLNNFDTKEPSGCPEILVSNILQNKTIQKNNLFKTSEESQYDEDRLLEELFYSDQSLNFGWESVFRAENLEEEKVVFDPFT